MQTNVVTKYSSTVHPPVYCALQLYIHQFGDLGDSVIANRCSTVTNGDFGECVGNPRVCYVLNGKFHLSVVPTVVSLNIIIILRLVTVLKSDAMIKLPSVIIKFVSACHMWVCVI